MGNPRDINVGFDLLGKRLTELSPQRRVLVEKLLRENVSSEGQAGILKRHGKTMAPLFLRAAKTLALGSNDQQQCSLYRVKRIAVEL
jgi:hypothetical protein